MVPPVLIKIRKECFVLAVLALLIFAFYGNTLYNGFVHDDVAQVQDNDYVHSFGHLPKVVTGCVWEHEFRGCQGLFYYRPLQNLSYLFTYQISPSAGFFHFVNLVYFLIAAFLVFRLVKIITENFAISFLTALIFIVHPINNEVIDWVSSVPELLYVIFVLLTVIFFIKYRQTAVNKNLYFSFFFYFLAILSKEPAVFAPIILLFVDLVFFEIKLEELFDWEEMKNYLGFAGLCFIYFLMRTAVLGGFAGLTHGGGFHGVFSLPERIYGFLTLFAQYLEKLIYPYPLLFFYSFEKSSNLSSFQFFASFFVVLLFFIAIFAFFKLGKNLLVFALIWLFVFLSPAVIFLDKAGENVFSERYLYASTIGFALILSYFLARLWQKNKPILKVGAAAAVILIVVLSWFVVYPRNKFWRDNETFYNYTLSQNPRAYPIRFNLSTEYYKMGKYDLAEKETKILIDLNPHWFEIYKSYNNLGELTRSKGAIDEAIAYYEKSVEASDGLKPDAFRNLGGIYAEKGEYVKSLTYTCKTLRLDPTEDNQFNFERVISMIKKTREEKGGYLRLYLDVMAGGLFSKSDEEKIRYKDKSCKDDICTFVFFPWQLGEKEFIFTFLTLANTAGGEMGLVEVKNSSYDHQTGEIKVEIDSQYKDKSLNFIFPTCDGIYYQTTVTPQ